MFGCKSCTVLPTATDEVPGGALTSPGAVCNTLYTRSIALSSSKLQRLQMSLLSTGEAAKRAGTSPATVRSVVSGVYADLYRGLWSETATPPPGTPRRFDVGDMKVLHYITSETARGQKHEDIAQRIRAGALDDFQMPTEDAEPPTEDQTALAVITLAQEYGTRLQSVMDAANERLLESERARIAAETRAEMLQARLDEVQAERSKGFFARLFGR